MSSLNNPDKGKLTVENFAEFSMDMLNTALRFGEAGEEIIEDVEKIFEMPTEDLRIKRKGMEGERYLFQRTQDGSKLTPGGQIQFEQALKTFFDNERQYKKNRGELVSFGPPFTATCDEGQSAARLRSCKKRKKLVHDMAVDQVLLYRRRRSLIDGGYHPAISAQTRQRRRCLHHRLQINYNKNIEEAS
jgi:hypothetical protein